MRRVLAGLTLCACGGLTAFNPDTDPPDTDPVEDTGRDTGRDTGEDTGDTADTGEDTGDTGEDTGADTGVLLITEVVDHADRGYIKYVELYNPGPGPVRMGGWALHRWSNGSTSSQAVPLPNRALQEGQLLVVANAGEGVAAFSDWYGRDADVWTGVVNGNGNDAYGVYDGSTLIDLYGEIGQDGTGRPWEYLDAVARRSTSVTAPSQTWQASEWTITGGSGQSDPFAR